MRRARWLIVSGILLCLFAGSAGAEVWLRGIPWVRLPYVPSGHVYPDVDWHPTAISRDGSVIVGNVDGNNGYIAVRWEVGREPTLLPAPPGTTGAIVRGISADGSTTFGNCTDANDGFIPVVWRRGVPALAGGSTNAIVVAASADGSVVVNSNGEVHRAYGPPAFVACTELFPAALSDDGSALVGQCGSSVIRWDGVSTEVIANLPVMNVASADLSTIVGFTKFPNSWGRTFMWINGVVSDLTSYPDEVSPVSITADGTIVAGHLLENGYRTEGVLWHAAHGVQRIEDLLYRRWGWNTSWPYSIGLNMMSGDGRTFVGSGSFGRLLLVADDPDADGVSDILDNCPTVANRDQRDTGGLGAGSAPDYIGDACQCGDVNGDGFVSTSDAVVMQRSLLAPPTATLDQPQLCDVGGSLGCTLADATIVRRALLVPSTAVIMQQCAPAAP